MSAQPEQPPRNNSENEKEKDPLPTVPTPQQVVVTPPGAGSPGGVMVELPERPPPRTTGSTFIHVSERYAESPYPPASMLADYNAAIPALGERLVNMIEAESLHRREMEKMELAADIDERKGEREIKKRGQRFGFGIGSLAIIIGGIVSIWGNPVAGGFIGTTGVVGLVSVFVLGHRAPDEKAAIPPKEQPKALPQ